MATLTKVYLRDPTLILPMPNRLHFPLEGREVNVDEIFWFRRLQEEDLVTDKPKWLNDKEAEDAKNAKAASTAAPAEALSQDGSAAPTPSSSKAKSSS